MMGNSFSIAAVEIGFQNGLPRVHPVHVALDGVDLAVVRNVVEGMRQVPGGKRVRRKPLMDEAERAGDVGIGELFTGLRVHAELDPGSYATGAKISDAQLAALPLTRHDWHPDWNYTLRPQAHHTQAAAPRPRPPRPRPTWPGSPTPPSPACPPAPWTPSPPP